MEMLSRTSGSPSWKSGTTFSNVFFGREKLQYELQENVARMPVGAFQAQSLELPVQYFSWRPERRLQLHRVLT
jgi:hypothetical protein